MNWLIVLAVVGVAGLWLVGMYNSLVRMKNQVDNSMSQIDVQLKRRHDLIPNLIETVKGYAAHEKTVLEEVTRARTNAIQAGAKGGEAQFQAETALAGAIRGLMVQVEAYSDLKANQNFLALQEELSSTENKIAFARQHYNDTVNRYNIGIEVFPKNFIAGMFNFTKRDLWQITDQAEREVPQVKF